MGDLRNTTCPECGKTHSEIEDCRDYVLAPEPHRMRTPALPANHGRTPVPPLEPTACLHRAVVVPIVKTPPPPARDAAWKAFYQSQCANWTPRDEMIAKTAFYAGWKTHKQQVLEIALGINQPAKK